MTTPQQPIGSGFGPATTSDDVLQGRDLSGRQAIVTGGYDGIGLETARKLAKAGAQNVWVGTRVEDQKRADERIQTLLQVPATVRFLSMEPLLGEVKLSAAFKKADWRKLHWVIVGGESGPGARPMYPIWARRIRNDCARHGVAFFFKQVGSNSWVSDRHAKEFLSVVGRVSSRRVHVSDQGLLRGSKKSGGRLLDRKLHEQMPVVPSGLTRKSR